MKNLKFSNILTIVHSYEKTVNWQIFRKCKLRCLDLKMFYEILSDYWRWLLIVEKHKTNTSISAFVESQSFVTKAHHSYRPPFWKFWNTRMNFTVITIGVHCRIRCIKLSFILWNTLAIIINIIKCNWIKIK